MGKFTAEQLHEANEFAEEVIDLAKQKGGILIDSFELKFTTLEDDYGTASFVYSSRESMLSMNLVSVTRTPKEN